MVGVQHKERKGNIRFIEYTLSPGEQERVIYDRAGLGAEDGAEDGTPEPVLAEGRSIDR